MTVSWSPFLISELKNNPKLLLEISSRDFEILIAELLAAFGWQVNVRSYALVGDHGIIAVRHSAAGLETSLIVECKRFAQYHKVDVEIVRQLVGIKSHFGITNALLVTTSSFTAGARKFAEARLDIQLIDYFKVIEWIHGYSIKPDKFSYWGGNKFQSCFISYSNKDHEFAQILVSKLRGAGIHVWFAPEDMVPGKKLLEQIKQAIQLFDRLLIILSPNSINSSWVKNEIRAARKREREEDRQILFPISIAPVQAIKNWECFDADSGEDLAEEVREYYTPNFSEWDDTENFNDQFDRVIRGLRSGNRSAMNTPSFWISLKEAETVHNEICKRSDCANERIQ